MNDPIASMILARTIEHLVIAGAGVFSMYLGYRLFMKGIAGESSLEATHNKSKLKLLKAAPGLFFALFGAAILIVVVTRAVKYDNEGNHLQYESPSVHAAP